MNRGIVAAVLLMSAWTSVVFAQAIRGDSKAGQGVYEQQCLRCYGANLDGNEPESQDWTCDESSSPPVHSSPGN